MVVQLCHYVAGRQRLTMELMAETVATSRAPVTSTVMEVILPVLLVPQTLARFTVIALVSDNAMCMGLAMF